MQARKNKHGSALISALFIMTLVAIAATAMSTRMQLDIYRTRLTIASDKLYLASQVVTFWAMDKLSIKNPQFTISGKDRTLVRLPRQLQNMYPGVMIKGSLYDMQALFNINNLQDRKFQSFFSKLLEKTLPKISPLERNHLFFAILHWINPYQPERGHDEYLDFYLKQKPAYMAGFQAMQNISELRLVRGVNADIYQALLTNVTALPEITSININTAPKQLLLSLGNGLNAAQVDEILQARGDNGITDLKDLSELIQKLDIPNEQITIESTYYLSIATAESEDLKLTTYTVIKRSKDTKGLINVGVVSESFNTI